MPFSAATMSMSASVAGARLHHTRARAPHDSTRGLPGPRVSSIRRMPSPRTRRATSLRVEASSGERVAVIGEALWDSLPAGLFLGGAPANVACHLNELGREATVISRVGDDELGREVMRRLKGRGLSTDCIQVDTGAIPTGFVVVTMAGSMPSYDIVQPSAWDAMEPTEQLVSAAKVSLFLLSYGQL